MTSYSAEDAADGAGVEPGYLARLVDLGILAPAEGDRYTPGDVRRLMMVKSIEESGIAHKDVDHLMIYDAFAHLPIYGLEDLGFCKRGEAAGFIWDRNTAPGAKLPLNTNGGGLSYMHSGMYGMYALQESVRQMRGSKNREGKNLAAFFRANGKV